MTRSCFFVASILTTSLVAAADWPQWMGEKRDDVWTETGILEKFPESGIEFLWRKPISGGFAGPAVAGGRVYVMDYVKSTGDASPAPTKRNDLQGRERVLCLDAKTGDEIWKHEYDCNGKSLNSLDPNTGRVYWTEPLATAFSMAIMAPRQGGDFLFAGGHNGKSLGLKLDSSRPAVTRVWDGSRTHGLAPVSGTPFVEDGVAYGIDGNGLFRAMRIATGERLWSTAKPVNGQDSETRGPNEGATFVTKNGDRCFIFGENGDLVIARLSPEKYDEISRTKLLDPAGFGLGRTIVWSHPAYADKCVFARNDREIVCASLAAK